jgi:hypothetical protein
MDSAPDMEPLRERRSRLRQILENSKHTGNPGLNTQMMIVLSYLVIPILSIDRLNCKRNAAKKIMMTNILTYDDD